MAETPLNKLIEDEVLKRRLELASGGIRIGITNKAGTKGDKCAHYEAMPGGPSKKYPNRPKGPGPKGSGAHYYSTTDVTQIIAWTDKYPGCNTLIGGYLPEYIACLDIDRMDEFEAACPGLFKRLRAAGFPMDKRRGKDRWHIWIRMPAGRSASELPYRCIWGEVKRRGGLVVSSPSDSYEAVVPLRSWDEVPELSEDDVALIVSSKVSFKSPAGTREFCTTGRHPDLLRLSAQLAVQNFSREYIIDAVFEADLRSINPAQLDSQRPGDFTSEVERMVDGAIGKFGIGAFVSSGSGTVSRPEVVTPAAGLPARLMEIEGLAGEIAAHINSQSLVHNPELAFCAGLVAMAHTCGRSIVTKTGLSPGIGIVVLAHSASGKEKPQAILVEIFHRAAMGPSVVQNIASGQGLEDWLEQQPRMLVLIDEVMHLFRDMADSRQHQFSPESILKQLLSGKTHYSGRVAAKIKGKPQPPVAVAHPHLTFFGAAVSGEFFDAINEQMVRGGLIGRLLCPVIASGDLVSPAPRNKPVPKRIINQVRRWSVLEFSTGDGTNSPPESKQIQFSPNASNRWESYRTTCHQLALDASNELAATLWKRAAEKAARLALIRAASREGVKVERITPKDMDWACDVVDFYTNQLIELGGRSIATNETEHKRNKFLDVMRRYLEKHSEKSQVPHSHVLRYTKLSGRECREVAADLAECGDILILDPKKSGPGRSPYLYAFPDKNSLVHDEIHGDSVNEREAQSGDSGTQEED